MITQKIRVKTITRVVGIFFSQLLIHSQLVFLVFPVFGQELKAGYLSPLHRDNLINRLERENNPVLKLSDSWRETTPNQLPTTKTRAKHLKGAINGRPDWGGEGAGQKILVRHLKNALTSFERLKKPITQEALREEMKTKIYVERGAAKGDGEEYNYEYDPNYSNFLKISEIINGLKNHPSLPSFWYDLHVLLEADVADSVLVGFLNYVIYVLKDRGEFYSSNESLEGHRSRDLIAGISFSDSVRMVKATVDRLVAPEDQTNSIRWGLLPALATLPNAQKLGYLQFDGDNSPTPSLADFLAWHEVVTNGYAELARLLGEINVSGLRISEKIINLFGAQGLPVVAPGQVPGEPTLTACRDLLDYPHSPEKRASPSDYGDWWSWRPAEENNVPPM